MKMAHIVRNRVTAYVVLISFWLQSCGGYNNPILPIKENQAELVQSDSQPIIARVNINLLIGKTLTAKGGHIVTFYKSKGELQATVKINALPGFSKTYTALPVQVGKHIDLTRLSALSTQEQEQFLHINIPKNGQRASVIVYRAGLRGGSNTTAQYAIHLTLHQAAMQGQVALVRSLLEEGADVNAKDKHGTSALYLAAQEGHLQTAKLLIEKGADVNVKGGEENTPLHAAASHNHIEIVKLLIEQGADVNIRCYQEASPLHAAAADGHIEIVKLLLEKQADVNAKAYNALSPLHLAVSQGHMKVVDVLLDQGADVNAKDEDGDSPLHLAASIGSLAIAKILLEKGADTNAINDEGLTPIELAARNKHTAVVQLIQTASRQGNINL